MRKMIGGSYDIYIFNYYNLYIHKTKRQATQGKTKFSFIFCTLSSWVITWSSIYNKSLSSKPILGYGKIYEMR